MLNLSDRAQLLKIFPLWRLGFRPFFLAGTLFAFLAIIVWLCFLEGAFANYHNDIDWLSWHQHEMLFGFGMAIIAGFLLTAIQNWTGIASLSGKPLMALFALWLALRIIWFIPSIPLSIHMLLCLCFMGFLIYTIVSRIIKSGQKHNLPIGVILILLTVCDLQSIYGIRHNPLLTMHSINAGLWLVASLCSVIAGRIIPFFTQRGLKKLTPIKPITKLEKSLLVIGILVPFCVYSLDFAPPYPFTGTLFLAYFFIMLYRAWRWFDPAIFKIPLLWSLHLAYWWLSLAPLCMALWCFNLAIPHTFISHILAIGGISGLIMAMISRVTLGHTGRLLEPPKLMIWSYLAINLSCIFRLIATVLMTTMGLRLAGLFWLISFGIFIYCYASMLWQPRVDGNPG